MLGFISDYYKNLKMYDKTIENFCHLLKFVTDFY